MTREKLEIIIISVIAFTVLFSCGLTVFPAINVITAVCFLGVVAFIYFGYRIPLTEAGRKIKFAFIGISLILFVTTVVYLTHPARLNPQEAQYIKHFDSGYEYFRADNYEKALAEYNLAQRINNSDRELYIRKAWCYQDLKEYEKAIAEAQEALKHDAGNSLYKKAKGFRLNGNNEVSIYTIIGESNYKLGNYKEASEAYTKVINQIIYKYSDVYFQRGKCEYRLGNYQKALADFNKHKSIINQYLQDQRESEYKAKHPTYTDKDLVKLEKWIKACEK